MREGYYGGATDYYKKYGKKLYYYDVNSLYPYVMKKDMPVVYKAYSPNLKNYNLDQFFGFALARIECPSWVKIPILPHRTPDNRVIYP